VSDFPPRAISCFEGLFGMGTYTSNNETVWSEMEEDGIEEIYIFKTLDDKQGTTSKVRWMDILRDLDHRNATAGGDEAHAASIGKSKHVTCGTTVAPFHIYSFEVVLSASGA